MKNKANTSKPEPIVTKDWLRDRLLQPDFERVLGRAIVAIYRNQEADEQLASTTKYKNGIGFSAFDAKIGTLAAEYFLKYNRLPQSFKKAWLRPDSNGYPWICRYAEQLNDVAVERAAKKILDFGETYGKPSIPAQLCLK